MSKPRIGSHTINNELVDKIYIDHIHTPNVTVTASHSGYGNLDDNITESEAYYANPDDHSVSWGFDLKKVKVRYTFANANFDVSMSAPGGLDHYPNGTPAYPNTPSSGGVIRAGLSFYTVDDQLIRTLPESFNEIVGPETWGASGAGGGSISIDDTGSGGASGGNFSSEQYYSAHYRQPGEPDVPPTITNPDTNPYPPFTKLWYWWIQNFTNVGNPAYEHIPCYACYFKLWIKSTPGTAGGTRTATLTLPHLWMFIDPGNLETRVIQSYNEFLDSIQGA
jgi:hypothetical protein